MWFRTTIAALVCGLMPAINGFGQVLQMGLDGVAWEDVVDMGNPVTSIDTGPLLFRNVNEADLVSVKARISAQTAGFWSQVGGDRPCAKPD